MTGALLGLTLPVAYILAGLSGCPAAETPIVEVQLHASDPPLDTSMTRQELTAGFANNPDSSLSTEPGWHIGGLALSDVQMRTGAQFREATFAGGTGCFWIYKINFDIVYNPVIFIASDYLHKKCHYTLTLAHEQRHVGTDLQTFNDYTPAIRRRLQEAAMQFGAQGPYTLAGMRQQEQEMLDAIDAAAQPVLEELVSVRRERQAQFDTQSNYEYESALCQDEEF